MSNLSNAAFNAASFIFKFKKACK